VKKRTVKSTKARAKNAFSGYIRLRDCLKTTGTPDYGVCITCGQTKHYDEGDAGHFVKATHSVTCFDERNANFQCINCNRFEDGRQYDHGKKLEKTLGEDVVEELIFLGHKTHKFTIDELDDIIDKYKTMTIELAQNQP
jgi:hypothetical protein